ncbi:MAG: hypothetical protein IJW24_04615 [Clostridia bacterium]|nr:hypothetical protein [Clostridia bacterium]
MKRFVYPMVVFEDKETSEYTVLFPDLDIVTSGNSVEEAYLKGKDYLDSYIDMAIKFESDLSSPCTYTEAKGMNPKRIVLLADSKVEEQNITLSQEEASYKTMIKKVIQVVGD